MKFEKIHLDDITRCYCASHMFIDGEPFVFFASEDPNSPCNIYSGEDFKNKENLWEDRGGCMSIIPFENRSGEFLAVNEFYLKVSPSHAKLVWGKKADGKWEVKDVFNLPYLHRFDIFHVDNKDYVLVTTIARDKKNKEDWTRPGQVYVGEIPADLDNERNGSGGRYYPCTVCAHGDVPDTIYVCSEGDRYHYDFDCYTLTRNYSPVPLSEVEDSHRPCSRCGGG